MKEGYASLIDIANFGTVRRYLLSAKFPIAGVLFVRSLDLLPELAALIDHTVNGNLHYRRRRFHWLCVSGQVRQGLNAPRNPACIDMERIDDDAPCEMIYLPPFYLIYMPALESSRARHHTLWPVSKDELSELGAAPTLTLLK